MGFWVERIRPRFLDLGLSGFGLCDNSVSRARGDQPQQIWDLEQPRPEPYIATPKPLNLKGLKPVLAKERKRPRHTRAPALPNHHKAIWVVVKIMVPFWVLNIIQHLIFRVPKKGP